MAFCRSCGAQLGEGAAFCPKCGTAQAATTEAAVAPVANPAATPAVGMTNNVAGALAYLLGLITGILFLVLEPHNKDKFVRFHAFQSIFFSIAWWGVMILFNSLWGVLFIGGLGFWYLLWQVIRLVELALVVCWIFLMYKAYNKEEFKLPIIGDLAAKQAGA